MRQRHEMSEAVWARLQPLVPDRNGEFIGKKIAGLSVSFKTDVSDVVSEVLIAQPGWFVAAKGTDSSPSCIAGPRLPS